MKVNIERHTLEIIKLQSRIRQLEEGIRDFLDGCKGEDHGIPDRIMNTLQKLLEEST